MSRTVGEITCWAQRRLRDAGIEEARLEARLLVSHVLGIDAAAFIAKEQDRAPAGFAARLHPLLKRREAREPLAHITGATEFYGLPIKSDRRALIPRADSEVVVDLALELLPKDARRVADLGTGTGCLLLAMLHQRPHLRGIGLDADPGAVSLARENAAALGMAERAEIIEGNWLDWDGWGGADLIISNPPYIRSEVIRALAPEVRDHDPRLALDGGAHGTDPYGPLAWGTRHRASAGTWLVVEIGYDQRELVSGIFDLAGLTEQIFRTDLGGNDRAIAARRPSP